MMEHEQINDKAVALTMRGTKATGRLMAQAMKAFLRKATQPHFKHGKQSLKSLTKQGATLADIEISGDNIGTFNKTARKYNIDYSLKKDSSVDPPRWTVFFKAKDDKAMQAAFNEYAKATLNQKSRKGSMLEKLARFKELAKSVPAKVMERVKNKGKDNSL